MTPVGIRFFSIREDFIRALNKPDMASWSPAQILKVYLVHSVHSAASFQHTAFGNVRKVMNSHLQDRQGWGKFTRAAMQQERDENVHCSDQN